MKKIILLIAFLISTGIAAQNIGINITIPEFNLDVRNILSSTQGPDFQLATTSKDHYMRLFGGRSDDPKPYLLYSEDDIFRIVTTTPPGSTNWQERMTFATGGFLGIMNPSPSATLDINGVQSDGGSIASIKILNQGDGNVLLFDADDIDGIFDTLHIQRQTSTELTLGRGGGNIGINTNARKNIKTTINGPFTDANDEAANSPATLMLENIGNFGYKDKMILDGNSITTIDHDLYINENSTNNIILGLGGGAVGIGTDALASAISGYKLSVDGKVISEGYRCQLSGVWPDYVFLKNYNLIPISSLEESIIHNGHLPGLPSAKKVKEEGFALEEIQIKLLEKIEEMTLYIIQLNKRISSLENQNRLLMTPEK